MIFTCKMRSRAALHLPCVSLKIIAHLRTFGSQSDSSIQQPRSILCYNILNMKSLMISCMPNLNQSCGIYFEFGREQVLWITTKLSVRIVIYGLKYGTQTFIVLMVSLVFIDSCDHYKLLLCFKVIHGDVEDQFLFKTSSPVVKLQLLLF